MPKSKRDKLRNKAKKAPNKPGVYFFRQRRTRLGRGRTNNDILYIGRAGSLKNRLQNYFNTKDSRIAEMVETAVSLDWEQTKTLLEAVVLEANLIKKYWPKYNVKEKDDKSFIYLVIDTKKDFPKLLVVRGKDLAKYMSQGTSRPRAGVYVFGPYQSYRILKTALELLRPIFPYSTCTPNSKRPCFHFQIGLCPGVCTGQVSSKEYKKNISNLIFFFKGEKKRLLSALKKEKSNEAIRALDHVRDIALLQKSSKLLQKSNELSSLRIEGYDISHLAGKEPVGAMVVFEDNEPNKAEYRIFKIRGEKTQSDTDMLKEVVERRIKHAEWAMPDIVFVDGGLAQVKAVRDILAINNMRPPVVGLSKAGMHSQSSAKNDKLVILNTKKVGKELLVGSKKVFQQVRDEAHRFSINFGRRQRTKFIRRK
ncbi:MAG: hypothetical protein R3B52_00720 [Candidatus Paceibacterota bacterium]